MFVCTMLLEQATGQHMLVQSYLVRASSSLSASEVYCDMLLLLSMLFELNLAVLCYCRYTWQ